MVFDNLQFREKLTHGLVFGGPLRLGALGPGPPGPLVKTALGERREGKGDPLSTNNPGCGPDCVHSSDTRLKELHYSVLHRL